MDPSSEWAPWQPGEVGSPCELIAKRTIVATPERLFTAFREPQQLARWWGPNGFRSTFHQFDFRVGGSWRLTMHGPDGKQFANELVFVAIEPERRVVVDHLSPPRYVGDFTFEPVAGGTRMLLRQVFETAAQRDRIARFAVEANEQLLERLARVVG